MTTSAPPPRDPELAADPDYRQAAAEDWWGRVADYYADQQAEADEEARAWRPRTRSRTPARWTPSTRRPWPKPRPARPGPARLEAGPKHTCPAACPMAAPEAVPSRTEPEAGAMTRARHDQAMHRAAT